MQIIKDAWAFGTFYFYVKKYLTPDKYPIKYPYVVEHIERGGRMGSESIHNVPSYVFPRQETKILDCIKIK